MDLTLYRQAAGDLAPPDGLEALRAFECRDATDQAFLAEGLRAVKAKAKELEARRAGVAKPLRAAAKEVDSWFRPALEALKEAEGLIKGKLAAYLAARPALNTAALQEVARAETVEEATEALASVQPAAMPEGTHTRKVLKWEVTDEDAIPREYLMVNKGLIDHVVCQGIAVPGVRTWREVIVVAR